MHHVKTAFSSGEFRCFGLNATVLQHTLVGCIFQVGMVADNAFVEALFLSIHSCKRFPIENVWESKLLIIKWRLLTYLATESIF